MKSYRYRVQVEMIAGQRGEPVEREPLVFEAANHDDILSIAERTRLKKHFADDDTANALAIGLKLFGEVAIHHRNDELFTEALPAIRAFVARLKALPMPGDNPEDNSAAKPTESVSA